MNFNHRFPAFLVAVAFVTVSCWFSFGTVEKWLAVEGNTVEGIVTVKVPNTGGLVCYTYQIDGTEYRGTGPGKGETKGDKVKVYYSDKINRASTIHPEHFSLRRDLGFIGVLLFFGVTIIGITLKRGIKEKSDSNKTGIGIPSPPSASRNPIL